ncbi:MAG: GNAT family N-acetyltransferase [Ruminococcaceae bacterium]|nr:GNAT family N-acetyltransferase [Oscillospiraceae bacterium]
MRLDLVLAYEKKEDVRAIFTEYTDMLIEGDSKFKEYLQLQRYEDELEHLEVKYGLPHGRLYLVYCDGDLAGSIALRRLDERLCELKRLYVRPPFRGRHIADFLMKTILDDARAIGYQAMLLDTLPFLKEAIALYKKYGFYEIPCYNNSPMDNSLYLKLDL